MTERASVPSLSLVGVGHSFSGSSELFRGLDVTLRAGEVVAVVGPSGSGKSTVLHLVAGWEVPTSGYVSRDGVHSIAWVFQNPHGSTWRTALDHVVLPLLAAGADRPRAEIEAMAILERYDLSEVARRPFRHLSGGEAQRLMLARAVATAPDLLLVDEPTAQLDPLTASSLVRTLGGIADGGRIVVVATHAPQVWAACTQVIDLGNRSQDRSTLTTPEVAEERDPAGRQRERLQPAAARRGAGSVEDDVPAHSEGSCLGSRPRSRAQGWLGGMRPGAVLSEAWRDLVSGSARAATWAAAAALVLGLVAAVDARTTVALMSAAEAFRASGASIQVLDAAGGVDATQCEALAQVDGIVSAGALRATSEDVTPLALPSSELRVVEASPGLARVLGVGDGGPDGVWLSDSVATTLDHHAGRALLTTDGPVEVGGLFAYPPDGRATLLENAVIAQVPGTGDFDACWAEVWPTDDERSGLLPLALTPGADATQVRQGQLNASRGQHHDPAELYESRPTRWAGEAAVLGGLVLGFVSVRMRRLDVASALHAGVPRTALAVQLLYQSAAWAAAGMFLTLPLLWWAASGGSSSDGRETWTAAVLVVGGGAAAILSGTVLATCSIRESQLFRYFKDR